MFQEVKSNPPIIYDDFDQNGCPSIEIATEERCGGKDGYAPLRGPGYGAFVCSNCHRMTTIYNDQEIMVERIGLGDNPQQATYSMKRG